MGGNFGMMGMPGMGGGQAAGGGGQGYVVDNRQQQYQANYSG